MILQIVTKSGNDEVRSEVGSGYRGFRKDGDVVNG
jgi:hypothetical protein